MHLYNVYMQQIILYIHAPYSTWCIIIMYSNIYTVYKLYVVTHKNNIHKTKDAWAQGAVIPPTADVYKNKINDWV